MAALLVPNQKGRVIYRLLRVSLLGLCFGTTVFAVTTAVITIQDRWLSTLFCIGALASPGAGWITSIVLKKVNYPHPADAYFVAYCLAAAFGLPICFSLGWRDGLSAIAMCFFAWAPQILWVAFLERTGVGSDPIDDGADSA